MKKKINLFFITLTLLFIIPFNVKANEKVNIYLFYSETCVHCHHADEAISKILEENDYLSYYKYEVTKDTNAYNREIFNKVKKIMNINKTAFPTVVIGNEYIIGYGDITKDNYLELINFYHNNNYKDEVGILLNLVDDNGNEVIKKDNKHYNINIPFLGKVNISNLSLTLVSIIIGFTDGFNPCAMWILLFLIAMLFNMKNRRKMWILGLTFILTSGFIYFIFMMSWLEITDYINEISILQKLTSIIAIIFGIYNLYNYFKEKKSDGCTVIKKEKRHFIMEKIKRIVENKSFILAIIGIIILAIMVNLIELLCSLGLPIMFTEILSLNNLSPNKYFTYIGIYIFFFMIDDIIIFIISMITLKQTAISTKYNKYSHLIGGIIMLIIGILLIINPNWLSLNFK